MTDTATSSMTDDASFITYCQIHCTTERALFSGAQINRMLKLAGNPPDYVRWLPASNWYSVHEHMQLLCTLARERLNPTQSTS